MRIDYNEPVTTRVAHETEYLTKRQDTMTTYASKVIIPSALSVSQLASVAPGIFGTEKHESRSDKYQFFSTMEIINQMEEAGFVPTWACQGKTRGNQTSAETRKHMVRFARISDLTDITKPAAERPEVVLVNSHNGSAAYRLLSGIFRLVCSNGMIMRDTAMGGEDVRIRHMGHTIDDVVKASLQIVDNFDSNFDRIDEMKSIKLSEQIARQFAREAAVIRFGEEAARKGKIRNSAALLRRRRMDDSELTLWNVFNAVQENIMKGGVSVTGRRMSAITNIDKNININSELWNLAESYRIAA